MKNRNILVLLVSVTGILTALIISEYLTAVMLSVLTNFLLQPFHQKIIEKFKLPSWAATITSMFLLFTLVITPLLLISILVGNEIAQIVDNREQLLVNLDNFIAQINNIIITYQLPVAKLETANLIQAGTNLLETLPDILLRGISGIGSSGLRFLTNTIVYISTLTALLNGYPKLVDYFERISPLPENLHRKLWQRMQLTAIAMTKSIFVIALVQAFTTGLFLILAGVPNVLLWTVVTFIAAIIPLGAGVVSITVGVTMMLSGSLPAGLFVLIIGGLVVTNIDNLLRPKLMPKEIDIPESLVLLAILGGISWFGFLGIVYGPLIVVMFMTCVEVYIQQREH